MKKEVVKDALGDALNKVAGVENKKEDANAGFYNAMAERIRLKFNN